jgi:hypothetical protein
MLLRISVAPFLVVFAFGASIACAQQPAAPAMPAVPACTCVKPELPPSYAAPQRMNTFNREYKVYGDCVKKYIDDTNALANATIAAGKAAIDEFNALNAEMRAREAAK